MGGGQSHETQYTYVDNTESKREEARQLEQRRLENERNQRENQERLRIKQEKRREEKRRRAEFQQQRQREVEQEEAREREEEEKRLRLQNELFLRRAELFDYKFGNKIKLDSFKGLAIDDVTQLRIGVFGPTGSGKSCFINTCERAVRQTDKGTAPDSTTGQEGTITLQDYLPELFFHLVDTRGFFNYNANETVEFKNILDGKIQPGDNVVRPKEDQEDVPAVDLHPCASFANRLHGIIIVAKANDPRLREGALKDYLKPVRDILRRTGIAPITVVTHRDKLRTEEECENALYEASAATGSSPSHTFFVSNYCKDNSERNPETERMTFHILHYALLTAERAVKIMKQKQRNKEEDEMMRALEGTNVSGQVAPDSADASVQVFLRFLQNEYQWSNNGMKEVFKKLSKDDITTISLLAICWSDVKAHFPTGMRKMVEKELKRRNMISQECHVFKSVHSHPDIDEAAQGMKEAVNDLGQTLEEAASESGVVSGLIDSIGKAVAEISQPLSDDRAANTDVIDEPFVNYQERMTRAMKELTMKGHDMVGKSTTDPTKLGPLGKDISKLYNDIAKDTKGAVKTVGNPEIAHRIRTGVQILGEVCISLIQSGAAVQSSPKDPFSKRELAENCRHMAEKVSHLLAALQQGSRGTQACINAASAVQGIVGDLDTTVMFAATGTLHPETEGDTFGDHREAIRRTAKTLVEDTKNLVSAAQASQDVLASAAQSAVGSVSNLADNVKLGAIALGSDDSNAQQMLLNAAKDVASALGALINATKNASGKPNNDPATEVLKTTGKTMVASVSSLLKTVKSVEDKALRGTRALESTIDAVKQAVLVVQNPSMPVRDATPEELIRSTKDVTLATAKAVAAGNSCQQDDIITAANMGRKAVTEMLIICKAAAHKADNNEARTPALRSGMECGAAFGEMLDLVHNIVQKPTQEKKLKLTPQSKLVADHVAKLVHSAEALKGADWVNPEDPNVIAENELLGAAAAIEAAARKLAELKPKPRPKEADESLNFEEQILEAAKAITAATVALVKSASVAQKELVATGRVCSASTDPNEDGQWSQGLVSAARMVAAATTTLCDAANAAVQGNASEERLIAGAKQVSNSTAQLLLACRVKADSNSEAQRRLQTAGNAVKRAADNLVTSAKNAAIFEEQETTVIINQRFVGGIAQELEAQEKILLIEKELAAARNKLSKIRQAKYRAEDDD